VARIRKLDDGLEKLDKVTNDEARMASAEVLTVVHNTDEKVEGVKRDVQGVDENVKVVKEMMQMVTSVVVKICFWWFFPTKNHEKPPKTVKNG